MRVRRLTNQDAGRRTSLLAEGERESIQKEMRERFPAAISVDVRWSEGPYAEVWFASATGPNFAQIVRPRV